MKRLIIFACLTLSITLLTSCKYEKIDTTTSQQPSSEIQTTTTTSSDSLKSDVNLTRFTPPTRMYESLDEIMYKVPVPKGLTPLRIIEGFEKKLLLISSNKEDELVFTVFDTNKKTFTNLLTLPSQKDEVLYKIDKTSNGYCIIMRDSKNSKDRITLLAPDFTIRREYSISFLLQTGPTTTNISFIDAESRKIYYIKDKSLFSYSDADNLEERVISFDKLGEDKKFKDVVFDPLSKHILLSFTSDGSPELYFYVFNAKNKINELEDKDLFLASKVMFSDANNVLLLRKISDDKNNYQFSSYNTSNSVETGIDSFNFPNLPAKTAVHSTGNAVFTFDHVSKQLGLIDMVVFYSAEHKKLFHLEFSYESAVVDSLIYNKKIPCYITKDHLYILH